ncbi:MAG: glycine betaine/L-proline ABC transporter ATP-binding protein [Pseudomonadota bacterium]|nr:glycine betaine/L-proline ABC transporter ATP-binding protein [Pseudomonadota bacterium]
MAKIKAVNLTKIFGDHPQRALKLLAQGMSKEDIYNQTGQAVGLANVSFEVYAGEILVVMGLSGSGKSTLIRCLNRLIDPTEGQLFIDGVDINTLDHDALLVLRRHKLGMVFQHFALFPHRTILENVEYGLEVQGIDLKKRREKAQEALKLVGLEGWGNAMPIQLSGGMQQRVGLARALAVEPDILLMDEAFSALDPLIRGDMQHELISLQNRMKKTIVFITHDLDEALKIGNRVVLMKDGYVVQVGTPEEILTQPADDYVKRFVENVDKSKVLTAQSILRPVAIVAYAEEGPLSTLHKMRNEQVDPIFVVQRDNTFMGLVRAETVQVAVDRGDHTIEPIIETQIPRVLATDTLDTFMSIFADGFNSVPVVDSAHNTFQGMIVNSDVFAALAKQRKH